MYSVGTSCIGRDFAMLPKVFLYSIFQAIDGESLYNEFVGKYFYSLFEIICVVTHPGISNYL